MSRPTFNCQVCGSILGSSFSLKRHLGVRHLVDENGKKISTLRQDYLRMQSAKHYMRIGNRTPEDRGNLLDCNGDRKNETASPDCKNTGNQFVLLLKDFEEYLSKMYAKENSSKSEEMVEQPNSRRVRQKVQTTDRKQRKQLSNWTCY